LRFSSVVNREIKDLISGNKPTTVEVFSVFLEADRAQLATGWSFSKFVKTKQGKYEINEIPMVKSRTQFHVSEGRTPEGTMKPNLIPAFLNHKELPNIVGFMTRAYGDAKPSFSDSGGKDLLMNVKRINSPEVVNFLGIDCVSCHTATSYVTLAKFRSGEILDASAQIESERLQQGLSGITRTRKEQRFADEVQLHQFLAKRVVGGNNDKFARTMGYRNMQEYQDSNKIPRVDYVQRQFGYFNRFPMVGQRAIEESAIVAMFINTFVDLNGMKAAITDNALEPDSVDMLQLIRIQDRCRAARDYESVTRSKVDFYERTAPTLQDLLEIRNNFSRILASCKTDIERVSSAPQQPTNPTQEAPDRSNSEKCRSVGGEDQSGICMCKGVVINPYSQNCQGSKAPEDNPFGVKCRAAGGIFDGYTCKCPNGNYLNPNVATC